MVIELLSQLPILGIDGKVSGFILFYTRRITYCPTKYTKKGGQVEERAQKVKKKNVIKPKDTKVQDKYEFKEIF